MLALALVFASAGCASTMGRVGLNDGLELAVDGRGVKSEISVKCLTEAQISQLTGSAINPMVPKTTCYTVAFISSTASAISRAIRAYVNADNAFTDQIADVTGTSTPASSPEAKEIASKIVAAVIENKPTAKTETANLSIQLTPQLRSEVASSLENLSVNLQTMGVPVSAEIRNMAATVTTSGVQ